MLTPSTSPFRKRRPRPTIKPPAAPALTLVGATYNHDDGSALILTFDRAIDISGVDGSQIVVDDAYDLGLRFTGTGGATLDGPATVRIVLVEAGDATGVGTTLMAGAGNGIVAVADGGGTWAGVGSLELPFP